MRGDPAGRLELIARAYRGPTGDAPRHLPFRRAALSFMRWQARRGVLGAARRVAAGQPVVASGQRAAAARRMRGGRAAGGLAGEPSSPTMRAVDGVRRATRPAQLVPGSQREHRRPATWSIASWPRRRAAPERFFLNVVLLRVLYAHALVAAPRLALGRFAPLGRLLGDPRLGWPACFCRSRRVLPIATRWNSDLERYLADEQRLGRLLDYGVIGPRLQGLYEWSAAELGEPGPAGLMRDGSPV